MVDQLETVEGLGCLAFWECLRRSVSVWDKLCALGSVLPGFFDPRPTGEGGHHQEEMKKVDSCVDS